MVRDAVSKSLKHFCMEYEGVYFGPQKGVEIMLPGLGELRIWSRGQF